MWTLDFVFFAKLFAKDVFTEFALGLREDRGGFRKGSACFQRLCEVGPGETDFGGYPTPRHEKVFMRMLRRTSSR